jgi:hypothetical protein
MIGPGSRWLAADPQSWLIELNLIRPRSDADTVSAEPISELWSGDGPAIEVYDDLAELMLADPIHDVDEQAGWPTPRQTQ